MRAARDDELSSLQDIERAAGASFRELGMHLVADDEPSTNEELHRFQQDGRAWVSVDENDDPIAYMLVDVVDGWLNIEQVSVHPAMHDAVWDVSSSTSRTVLQRKEG